MMSKDELINFEQFHLIVFFWWPYFFNCTFRSKVPCLEWAGGVRLSLKNNTCLKGYDNWLRAKTRSYPIFLLLIWSLFSISHWALSVLQCKHILNSSLHPHYRFSSFKPQDLFPYPILLPSFLVALPQPTSLFQTFCCIATKVLFVGCKYSYHPSQNSPLDSHLLQWKFKFLCIMYYILQSIVYSYYVFLRQ